MYMVMCQSYNRSHCGWEVIVAMAMSLDFMTKTKQLGSWVSDKGKKTVFIVVHIGIG